MAIRLAVGPQTLNLVAQVRILDRQPDLAPSSSGLGHHPLKVEITGSNPVGATKTEYKGEKNEKHKGYLFRICR